MTFFLTNISFLISFILIVPGIFLVFVPMVPALWYMFIIALIFSVIDHFVHITLAQIALLFGLVILSMVFDTFSGLLGARFGGASARSLIWGLVGAIAGTVVLPPFGGLIGLFVAIFIVEYMRKDRHHALRAASGSVIGAFAGMAINCLVAITFATLFLIFFLY